MRKSSQITLSKLVLLCLTALVAASLLTCDQVYDNPVSADYKGDYKFGIAWNRLNTDTFEILKSYNITVTDSGEDKYFDFHIATEYPVLFDYEAVKTMSNTHKIKLLFKQPFTGKLSVIAVRPNLTEDVYDTNIHIVNPYIISGDTLVGRNVPAKLYITRLDEKPVEDSTFSVIWDTGATSFKTSSISDTVTLGYANLDTVTVSATIETLEKDSSALDPVSITFKGEAPVIRASLRDTLRLGEFPIIDVFFSNDDSGDISFNVTATAHGKSLTFLPHIATGDSGTIIICDEVISDTFPTFISVVATDSEGLTSVPYIIKKPNNVLYTIPEVNFLTKDSTYFRLGERPVFIASGEVDSFEWKIDGDALVDITSENTLELNPIQDVMWHTLSLSGYRLGLQSKPVMIRYKAKDVIYTIKTIKFPTEIKTRKQHSWEVQVVDKLGTQISNDSVQYFWSYPEECDSSYIEDGSRLYLNFKDSIPSFTIEVYAIVGTDSSQNETVPFVARVTTRVFRPICTFVYPDDSDSIKLMDSTAYKVDVYDTDTGGVIDTVFYKVISPSDSYTFKKLADEVWGYRFKSKGRHTLITWAVDSMGYESIRDTLTIHVTTDKPIFRETTLDTTIYIADSLLLTALTETDPDSIVSYLWDLDSDGTYDTATDSSSLQLNFPVIGTFKISVSCTSATGDYAVLPLIITVDVLPGIPVINSVSFNAPVFINDKCIFTVHAKDNGTIEQYLVSTDSLTYESMDDSVYTTSYKTSGWKYLYFKVVDNNDLASVYRATVEIKLGAPVLTGMTIENQDSLYVKDRIVLHYSLTDPNGKVARVYVSWNGDLTPEDSSFNSDTIKTYKNTFDTIFDTSSHGEFDVKLWAYDEDSVKSEVVVKTITIFKGTPVINNISPLETWAKANTYFKVNATDSNGTFLRTEMSFDSVTWRKPIRDTFSYTFDTFSTGEKNIWMRVTDEDSIKTIKKFNVTVNLGRPVLSGGSNYGNPKIQWESGVNNALDTMFYFWAPGQPSTIVVDTSDTNGTCDQFYWDWYNADFLDDTTVFPILNKPGLTSNELNRVTVTCKDNDSIRSLPYTFYVFPDGPPPLLTTTTSDANQDIRVIKWSGKDVRDGDSTLYKIVVKIGTSSAQDSVSLEDESNPAYIVSDFKPGREYEKDSVFDFKFEYTPDQGNGVYHYKIIARDVRGSVSRTAGDLLFLF